MTPYLIGFAAVAAVLLFVGWIAYTVDYIGGGHHG
jgi:hypothetical protein